MNCIFCKIVNNECPARIVYEDTHTVVFMDIAKDVVRFEKATVLEFFTIAHEDGKPTDDIWKVLIKIVATTFGFCFGWCFRCVKCCH